MPRRIKAGSHSAWTRRPACQHAQGPRAQVVLLVHLVEKANSLLALAVPARPGLLSPHLCDEAEARPLHILKLGGNLRSCGDVAP